MHCSAVYCFILHRSVSQISALYCFVCFGLDCVALHCSGLHCSALLLSALHCSALCTHQHTPGRHVSDKIVIKTHLGVDQVLYSTMYALEKRHNYTCRKHTMETCKSQQCCEFTPLRPPRTEAAGLEGTSAGPVTGNKGWNADDNNVVSSHRKSHHARFSFNESDDRMHVLHKRVQ